MSTVTEQELAGLEGSRGDLVRPGETGYEEARRVFNGLIDKHPALIARCRGEADIVDAVDFAREAGLEVSIRGGGHNVAGRAVTDGGVMIDLSPMKGIYVDPDARTVRAQPGVTWGELNRETQLHGLAVTGGVISTTGIAGLTLGGGLGWLMSMYGLATDNLVSARVVTADGRTLTASETENDDLFWGLRGGGGNFGVVSSFEYRLHEVGPTIIGGLVAHPFDAARDFLRFYRDFTANAPDELMTFAGVGARAGRVGHEARARRRLPRRHAGAGGGGSAAAARVRLAGHGPARPDAVHGHQLDPRRGLSRPGASTTGSPSFLSGLLRRGDRRAARAVRGLPVADDRGAPRALPRRGRRGCRSTRPRCLTGSPATTSSITSVWTDPAATDENVAWTKETFAALEPFMAGSSLPQLLLRGRRRRRSGAGRVRAELRPAGRAEEEVRPREPLPPEREHPAGLSAYGLTRGRKKIRVTSLSRSAIFASRSSSQRSCGTTSSGQPFLARSFACLCTAISAIR